MMMRAAHCHGSSLTQHNHVRRARYKGGRVNKERKPKVKVTFSVYLSLSMYQIFKYRETSQTCKRS